jgi:hypothetical protein
MKEDRGMMIFVRGYNRIRHSEAKIEAEVECEIKHRNPT